MLRNLNCLETRFRLLCRCIIYCTAASTSFSDSLSYIFIFGMAYSFSRNLILYFKFLGFFQIPLQACKSKPLPNCRFWETFVDNFSLSVISRKIKLLLGHRIFSSYIFECFYCCDLSTPGYMITGASHHSLNASLYQQSALESVSLFSQVSVPTWKTWFVRLFSWKGSIFWRKSSDIQGL